MRFGVLRADKILKMAFERARWRGFSRTQLYGVLMPLTGWSTPRADYYESLCPAGRDLPDYTSLVNAFHRPMTRPSPVSTISRLLDHLTIDEDSNQHIIDACDEHRTMAQYPVNFRTQADREFALDWISRRRQPLDPFCFLSDADASWLVAAAKHPRAVRRLSVRAWVDVYGRDFNGDRTPTLLMIAFVSPAWWRLTVPALLRRAPEEVDMFGTVAFQRTRGGPIEQLNAVQLLFALPPAMAYAEAYPGVVAKLRQLYDPQYVCDYVKAACMRLLGTTWFSSELATLVATYATPCADYKLSPEERAFAAAAAAEASLPPAPAAAAAAPAAAAATAAPAAATAAAAPAAAAAAAAPTEAAPGATAAAVAVEAAPVDVAAEQWRRSTTRRVAFMAFGEAQHVIDALRTPQLLDQSEDEDDRGLMPGWSPTWLGHQTVYWHRVLREENAYMLIRRHPSFNCADLDVVHVDVHGQVTAAPKVKGRRPWAWGYRRPTCSQSSDDEAEAAGNDDDDDDTGDSAPHTSWSEYVAAAQPLPPIPAPDYCELCQTSFSGSPDVHCASESHQLMPVPSFTWFVDRARFAGARVAAHARLAAAAPIPVAPAAAAGVVGDTRVAVGGKRKFSSDACAAGVTAAAKHARK